MADDVTVKIVDDPNAPVDTSQDPGVTVDLAKGKVEPEKQQPGETDEAFSRRLQAIENQLAATRRVNERLQKELEATRHVPPPAPVASQDELDQLVEKGQWKEAVSRLAAKEAEKLYEQRVALSLQQQALERRKEIWEVSKQKAVAKYPALDPETGDPESELWNVYAKVYEEHPDWLSNEYGPILAMHEMEDRLLASKAPPSRRSAVSAGLPPSRSTPGKPSTVTLTREQKDFCDRNGIAYDAYAHSIAEESREGGVST